VSNEWKKFLVGMVTGHNIMALNAVLIDGAMDVLYLHHYLIDSWPLYETAPY
jgi:hypothetical protein